MPDALATYLNDHLAGSVTALELGGHLRDTEGESPLGRFLVRLLGEIEEDQAVLKGVLARVGAENPLKQGGAWLAEKAARLKMAVTPGADAGLRRLEALEVLVTGIRGKRALWDTLREAAPSDERVAGPDYVALAARARRQEEETERHRLAAAREALGACA